MAKLEYRKLDEAEIARELSQVSGWQIEDAQLTSSFSFESYQEGVLFAASVGRVADTLDHHPEMVIGYRKVRVSVNTHAVEGISPYDFELARRVNGLLQK